MNKDKDVEGCLACDLTAGRKDLPGGRIYANKHWVVESCVGPLPVGTLIIKPLRHVLTFPDLTEQEAAEYGPLLHKVSRVVKELAKAESELIKGDQKVNEGKFDKAIDHYKKAWKHAQKAI